MNQTQIHFETRKIFKLKLQLKLDSFISISTLIDVTMVLEQPLHSTALASIKYRYDRYL